MARGRRRDEVTQKREHAGVDAPYRCWKPHQMIMLPGKAWRVHVPRSEGTS